jgi:hypothetical protein
MFSQFTRRIFQSSASIGNAHQHAAGLFFSDWLDQMNRIESPAVANLGPPVCIDMGAVLGHIRGSAKARLPTRGRHWLGTFKFFSLLLVALAWRATTFADSPAADNEASSSPTEAQIRKWISQLESDSYAVRKTAFQLLQPHPISAMALVEASIPTVDVDAAHHLLRLLAGWAYYPDVGFGRDAFSALTRLAEGGISSRSSFAKSIIAGIAEDQETASEDFIRRLSGSVGFDASLPLFLTLPRTFDTYYYALRIEDRFRGTAEDLICLRWLKSVEAVRLEGRRINGEWLKQVVQLTNVRALQMRNVSITGRDLEWLHRLEHLEALEILYCPIEDDAIERLSTLPVAGKIRIFGTRISEEGIERLKTALNGAQIYFGRGGFLGIGTNAIAGSRQSLVLTQVMEGSGAEQAGLKLGDMILKIDGKELNHFDELRAELAKHAPGESVVITYARTSFKLLEDQKSERISEVYDAQVVLGEQQEPR